MSPLPTSNLSPIYSASLSASLFPPPAGLVRRFWREHRVPAVGLRSWVRWEVDSEVAAGLQEGFQARLVQLELGVEKWERAE